MQAVERLRGGIRASFARVQQWTGRRADAVRTKWYGLGDRWRSGLRERIGWLPIGAIAAVIVGLFVWGMVSVQQDMASAELRQIELNQAKYNRRQEVNALTEELASVGSKAYLEREARAMGYMKAGEIRFEIVNPEALANYTAEENQVLLDEQAIDLALISARQAYLED